MNKEKSILLVLILIPIACFCQNKKIDSLLKVLQTSKIDTDKVWILLKLSKQIQNFDPKKSTQYALEGERLSRKIKYKNGIYKSILRETGIQRALGFNDSVLILNQRFLTIAKNNNDIFQTGIAYLNLSSSYDDFDQEEIAIEFGLKGLKIIEKSGDKAILASTYDNLQNLYFKLENYSKAIYYGENGLKITRELGLNDLSSRILFNLSRAYVILKLYSKATNYCNESIKLAGLLNDSRIQSYGYALLCEIYLKTKNYNEAKRYAELSHFLAQNTSDKDSEATALVDIGLAELQLKNYNHAIKVALEAINIQRMLKNKQGEINATKLLADSYFAIGEPNKAYEMELKCNDYNLIINKQIISKKSLELEKKYETEKKNHQIQVQNAALQHKNILNYIFEGTVLVLIIFTVLFYRNYKQKQTIQRQRIYELENEKQLSATEAVLKSEEIERTRIAKDLHDGLGGILSGVKFSLHNMKENLIITPSNSQAFERSIDMLDNAIKEMRRVAHNMMPESLARYGLNIALKDFTAELNTSGIINVIYQSMDMENIELKNNISVTIYRIVQELLNNVIKHAEASQVLVQLLHNQGKLIVIVEDNGIGFDIEDLRNERGMGLNNIQSRVDYLKGKIEIQSQQGKGTSVNIELNII